MLTLTEALARLTRALVVADALVKALADDGADTERARLEAEARPPLTQALGQQLDDALAGDVTDPDTVAGRVDDDDPALGGAVFPLLERSLILALQQAEAMLGPGVDYAAARQAALDWARTYRYDLVRGVNETSRDVLRRVVADAVARDAGRDALRRALEPTFGEARARLIAETEVTRAFNEGLRAAMRAAGVRRFVFRTAGDEKVCPQCGPLDGRVFDLDTQAATPPLHPRCRCWLTPMEGA